MESGLAGRPPDLAPLSAALGVHLAGLAVGMSLGVGLIWLYTHHIESL